MFFKVTSISQKQFFMLLYFNCKQSTKLAFAPLNQLINPYCLIVYFEYNKKFVCIDRKIFLEIDTNGPGKTITYILHSKLITASFTYNLIKILHFKNVCNSIIRCSIKQI